MGTNPKKTKKTSETPPRGIAPIRQVAEPRSHSPSMSEDPHVRIVKRAYEIYERRIRQGALDDWLQAEREILQESHPHRGGYAGEEQQ